MPQSHQFMVGLRFFVLWGLILYDPADPIVLRVQSQIDGQLPMAEIKVLRLACVASEGVEQWGDIKFGPFCEKETSVRGPLRRSKRVDVGVGVMKEDVFQISCQ